MNALATAGRVSAVVAALPLVACVSLRSEDYPSRWPALARGAPDCAPVAGTYADAGERVGRNVFERDSLSAQLGALKSTPFGMRTARVAISLPDDGAMDVTVSAPDGRPVGTLRFSRETGDFACRGGSIEMTARSAFSVQEQTAAQETETVALSKATDGSLVLARSQLAYGVTGGVIPVFASGVVSWSRFEAVASTRVGGGERSP